MASRLILKTSHLRLYGAKSSSTAEAGGLMRVNAEVDKDCARVKFR